jgi:hypothetical protein
MSMFRFERVERVTWQRREWHPVGDTREQMAACMEWVRSLGHEAKSLDDDGFRYRSVYPKPSEYTGSRYSGWQWVEPGEWLMHMVGGDQDSEIDAPHACGPGDEEFYMPGFQKDWHQITEPETP